MTNNGFIIRGYKPVNPDECGYPRFMKEFLGVHGVKYYIVVTRYPMMMVDNDFYCGVMPCAYEYEIMFYQPGGQKPIRMTFNHTWDVKDVEDYIERVYKGGLIGKALKI